MVKQKYYLALTNEEWRLMIECLNKLRNRLISGGKYTDAVDEVIIKTDERTGLKYELVGDYYLIAGDDEPEEEQKPIGIWGQRHLRYQKNHRKVLYANLLTSGKLNDYLADIDNQAEKMFERLTRQMTIAEGVTEQLKADNQMAWVGKMNSIRNRAAEIINTEIIYT